MTLTAPTTRCRLENATVCVTVQRPPHVHFFKHAIEALEAAGHTVHVFVRDSEITTDLLDCYDIDYTVLAENWLDGSLVSLGAMQAVYETRLLRRMREIEPDVVTGVGGLEAAHAGRLAGARSVVFTDTEHATVSNRLMAPFADTIWTPKCFTGDFGRKHVRYSGYQELAYLHPDRFDPDPNVLLAAGVSVDRPLAVVRFTEWDALHDIGAEGLGDPVDVVNRLEAAGYQVRITTETSLPHDLSNRYLDVPIDRIHDLLAYATVYLGEGATMAAESAVLGTPALYVNTLRMGYTDELDARYGLLYNFQGAYRHENALRMAERIARGIYHTDWEANRDRLLEETVDTTAAILDALGVKPPATSTGTGTGTSTGTSTNTSTNTSTTIDERDGPSEYVENGDELRP